MPTTYTIPSYVKRTCYPCEHHKMVNALFGGPGNVWREFNCMHPEAFDPEREKIRQRLIGQMLEHGRSIGRTDRQPDWCPLLRKK